MSKSLVSEIKQLKEQRNAIILAHYYVDGAIQDIADYVGDSYYLSRIASETSADVLVFAGVNFMADSAKILSPNKIVLHPDTQADCPMAHMVTVEKIKHTRKMVDDLAVVCYINSSTQLKAESDVIVTSANAVKVTNALPNKNIFFIPDRNLGKFVAKQLPHKHFIFNDGYCHVHENMDVANIMIAKELNPEIVVLAHPECNSKILAVADYIGSTTGIIEYVGTVLDKAFFVCTEIGVLHEMKKRYPDRMFYHHPSWVCEDMRKITLQKICDSLRTLSPEVILDEALSARALLPLARMLVLAK